MTKAIVTCGKICSGKSTYAEHLRKETNVVLSSFVGGGDMNGIIRILPETAVRIVAGVLARLNSGLLFRKVIPSCRRVYLEKAKNK